MVGNLRFRLKKKKKKKKSSPTRVDPDFGVHSQIDSDFFFFCQSNILKIICIPMLRFLKRIIGVETTEDEV